MRRTYSNVPASSWTVDLIPPNYPETQITRGDHKTEMLVWVLYSESVEVIRSDDKDSVCCSSESLVYKEAGLEGGLSEIPQTTGFTAAIDQSAVVCVEGNIKDVVLCSV